MKHWKGHNLIWVHSNATIKQIQSVVYFTTYQNGLSKSSTGKMGTCAPCQPITCPANQGSSSTHNRHGAGDERMIAMCDLYSISKQIDKRYQCNKWESLNMDSKSDEGINFPRSQEGILVTQRNGFLPFWRCILKHSAVQLYNVCKVLSRSRGKVCMSVCKYKSIKFW